MTRILTPVLLTTCLVVGCVGGETPLPPAVDASGAAGGSGGGGGPNPGVGGRGGPAPGEGGSGGGTAGAGGTGGGAGGAGGGGGACRPEDCKSAPVPAIGCADGTAPTFTCNRLPSGACGWTNPMCPGGRDAGAGPDRPAGGGACGSVTCGAGTVCCNASCGICTPPGQACIQIACLPDGGGGTPTPGACRTNDECRLFDDYCTGCDCRALAKGDPDPKCSGPGVRCILPPCQGKAARCEAGKCVVVNPDGTTARWWLSCGDPVCGGWRPKPDVPRCMPNQQVGLACSQESAKPCDPGNDCNALLVCATSDPTKQPGGCPRSRLATKRDVHYLAPEELRQYHDQLLGMKLATWRYKHDPARQRLGFIIDDQPARSMAVEPPGEIVDLYGYTSLAVATLQLQARELEALRAQMADLERKMKKLERARRR